eukprot:jgi/Botrbrau1/5754/Bobra.0134s0026.2
MGGQQDRVSDGESASSSDIFSQNLEPRDYGDELGTKVPVDGGYPNEKGENRRDALSILLRLADALGDDRPTGAGGGLNGGLYYPDDLGDRHMPSKRDREAQYDIMDSYHSLPKRSMSRKLLQPESDEEEEEEDEEGTEYVAQPFNTLDIESAGPDKKELEKHFGRTVAKDTVLPSKVVAGETPFRFFQRQSKPNWIGILFVTIYVLSLFFYLYVRVTHTLDLGKFLAYGIFVLIVEIMGATTTILYGVNILLHPVHEEMVEDPAHPGVPKVSMPYHIRVLVPCYKESFEIVARTCTAAHDALLPYGCRVTVYLCDDGKDPLKRKWCLNQGPSYVYVSGRTRKPGEMNGKSANLNNCLQQIYPDDCSIPPTEIICVFDADQVANTDFYIKTLPLFDAGDDVGMVLSPQCFHNLRLHADIFNHSNIHFWEYAQHGYDAIGFISCTGTNFLIRAAAFREAGWSPEYTLTEDFALGMVLKMNKWHCRYVEEYLAVGEAPEQVRNCFQQRSRWCKGHFQIIMSREHSPLFQKRLSFGMKILYCSGVWSYMVGALTTPLFILIPLLTVWAGVFPIVVSWWAAVALTAYMVAQTLVLNYTRKRKHVEPLWFAQIANNIMWWTYVKACWRSFYSIFGKNITFKTTLKGVGARLQQSAIGDLWMPFISFVALLATLCIGLQRLIHGPTVITTLAISVVWIVYAMIPSYLLLHYTFIGRGTTLVYMCRLMFLVSWACSIIALLLLWAVYPADFNFGQATASSYRFYEAQRVGALPPSNSIPWRGPALLYERSPKFGFDDLTGGWLNGGAIGDIKMTHTTAFTTSMLAWSILAFPKGYQKGNAMGPALAGVRWGADYLLKTFRPDPKAKKPGGLVIVYQVGNLTTMVNWWGPPEAMTEENMPRPAYIVRTEQGTSDLAGSMVGALVSTALVFRQFGNDTAYSGRLMDAATQLYVQATRHEGLYASKFPYSCVSKWAKVRIGVTGKPKKPLCVPPTAFAEGSALVFYNSTSYYDDLLWAAAWMYRATGNSSYLNDVNKYYEAHKRLEGDRDKSLVTNWDNLFWASNVLLATTTDAGAFHIATQVLLLCTVWPTSLEGRSGPPPPLRYCF